MQQWNTYSENLKLQYQGLATKYNDDVKRWNEHSKALTAENQRLSRWKNIADADVRAAQMLTAARATQEKAQAGADNMIAVAQQRASSLLAETERKVAAQLSDANDTASTVATNAKEKAKALKDEAQAILDSATTQASKIVDAANKKAEEIGGSAYQALRNAALYERTVKAMKNVIEGYGDRLSMDDDGRSEGVPRNARN